MIIEKKCSICNEKKSLKKIGAFFYCLEHYNQMKNEGKIISGRRVLDNKYKKYKCVHCHRIMRGSFFNNKFYCATHKKHMIKYGKIVETKYDRNIFIKKYGYYEMLLKDKNFNIIGKVKLDNDDYDKVKYFKWCYEGTKGYCKTYLQKKRCKSIPMHRFILNVPNNMEVDHINGDKNDNRKYNLRICKKIDNTKNSSLRSDNTSGKRGVYFRKDRKIWGATIDSDKKSYFLGHYKTKEGAILARKKAEEKYHGEFANSEV